MTQIVDEKLKLMCNKCQSNIDKPCAWLSLGNEYCDNIMNIQKEIERLTNNLDELYEYLVEKSQNSINYETIYLDILDKMEKWR